MKPKRNLYTLLCALLCCVMFTGLLPTTAQAEETALTEGWTQCGTCEWRIDDDGVLTIRPLGDGSEGTLAKWFVNSNSSPWSNNTAIKSVVVKSGVTAATCNGMFSGCSSLTSLDVSGFDTSNVTDMRWMFWGCSSLTSLDLSGFDTSNVTSMFRMFDGCSSLTSLDVSGFDTANVTTMNSMFHDCSSLTSLDVSGFDTANVTTMFNMFRGCSSLTSLDVSGFDTANVTDMRQMFFGCSSLTSLDVSGFDTCNVATMFSMFRGCSSLTSLDVSGFDTCNVTDMGSMFSGCSSLTSLDVSGFDTCKVTDMGSMFFGCSSLTSLDVSGFDTCNVTDMLQMFYDCSSLTSLDVSRFDTGNVADMRNMFLSCSSLTSLDVSGFNTANVTYMGSMFNGCFSLRKATLGAAFHFKDGASLPYPPTSAPYTGKWTNGALSLTANELMAQYNGSSMAGTWVWETEGNTDTDQPTHTDFALAEDGSWYVYENGKINTAADNTLHFYNDAFFWIEKGKWNDKKHAFVDYAGAKFLVANGQAALGQNGLTQDPENEDIWYFCATGQIQAQANGLVMYQDEWFNVQNGRLDTTFSGYVDYDGSKFLVAAGRICKEADGLLVQDPRNPADWYYVAGGQVATAYTGLALHSDQKHWFYIENGKLNADYTGPVEYNGQTFDVINGALPVPEEN